MPSLRACPRHLGLERTQIRSGTFELVTRRLNNTQDTCINDLLGLWNRPLQKEIARALVDKMLLLLPELDKHNISTHGPVQRRRLLWPIRVQVTVGSRSGDGRGATVGEVVNSDTRRSGFESSHHQFNEHLSTINCLWKRRTWRRKRPGMAH